MSGGYEVLLCRWTWTATGVPLTAEEARAEFGAAVVAWTEPGWFHTAATPGSAARIREHGHKAVGAAITSWYPPQVGIVINTLAAEPDGPFRAVSTS